MVEDHPAIGVILVDDHRRTHEAVALVWAATASILLVTQASNGAEAILHCEARRSQNTLALAFNRQSSFCSRFIPTLTGSVNDSCQQAAGIFSLIGLPLKRQGALHDHCAEKRTGISHPAPLCQR